MLRKRGKSWLMILRHSPACFCSLPVGIMAHYWNGGYTIEKVAHYWNDGYTIGMVAILLKRWLTIGMVAILLEWWLYYWNGGYTIEIVTIIFLYKLISSSFVVIPSHPIPHILHISKWKRGRE